MRILLFVILLGSCNHFRAKDSGDLNVTLCALRSLCSQQNLISDTAVSMPKETVRQLIDRQKNFSLYFPEHDAAYEGLIVELFKEGGNFIRKSTCSPKKGKNANILFSKVYFNSTRSKAVNCILIKCGVECGETILFLFEKFDGNWSVVGKNTLSVS